MNDGKRILIVDDEPDMRIYLSVFFESNGYKPVPARSGKDGIIAARKEPPDLIVLDVMMPNDGGAVMYKSLISDPSLMNIPVIMLSAVPETTFKHYLTMLSAKLNETVPPPYAYVEKPPDTDALLALVKDALLRNG